MKLAYLLHVFKELHSEPSKGDQLLQPHRCRHGRRQFWRCLPCTFTKSLSKSAVLQAGPRYKARNRPGNWDFEKMPIFLHRDTETAQIGAWTEAAGGPLGREACRRREAYQRK
jgi:hypothetical protein